MKISRCLSLPAFRLVNRKDRFSENELKTFPCTSFSRSNCFVVDFRAARSSVCTSPSSATTTAFATNISSRKSSFNIELTSCKSKGLVNFLFAVMLTHSCFPAKFLTDQQSRIAFAFLCCLNEQIADLISLLFIPHKKRGVS